MMFTPCSFESEIIKVSEVYFFLSLWYYIFEVFVDDLHDRHAKNSQKREKGEIVNSETVP
jgi:hypothetical protein